ncbi:hypothetical protein [Streptomyces sp. CRN 30]|uniref:hypothetical protein n=1 Tax=Streptomyces sp. CRN 30 TaxID=3075613 RepID=UPI002A802052|nr:hypothetical protein [Streptomyces sp. CRN 30]
MTWTGMRWPAGRVSLVLAVLAAVVGVVVGACGAVGGSEGAEGSGGRARTSPAAAVTAGLRDAERATRAARSARVESSTRIGSTVSLTAEGVLGWSDGVTGTLTLTHTGGALADTMRELGSTSIQARYLPDAYYARMGDAFAAKTGGRHWVRYPYEELDDVAGGSRAQLGDQIRASTPDRSLRSLLDSADVREVGVERVRGRAATRYAGTVESADGAEAGVFGQTVEVWIDDRDLLVKKVERARTPDGEVTQTAHYRDYGVRVPTRRPPVEDTAEVSELLAGDAG